MSWEEERGFYADKLEQIIRSITKIHDLKDNRIVTSEMASNLRRLQEEAECLLPKLKKGEFEIAVVGLEKAGKSSFSNALIGLTALPTADERCTFTSTCIRPVDEGKTEGYAEVTFYNPQEFDRSFREKLEALGIPDAHLYTIDNLSPEKYEQLFEDCDPLKKQLYENSLHQDILATLQNKHEIRQYIGSQKRTFSEAELKTQEFSSFITSPGKAIAAKSVVIYSTELRTMPNTVMYDVPGFNSPTAMHEEQTLQKMRQVDAIIMVAKAHEPTLTAEVLKIFQKPDMDGSYLKDKLFVFANKADLATDLEKNKDTTYYEWMEHYKILPNTPNGRERIVFGSARACQGDEEAQKKLGMPDGGIKILRDKLQTYYETTRFEVLKKRVNKILVDIKAQFDGVEKEIFPSVDHTERNKILLNLRRELPEKVRVRLDALKVQLNTEAVKERPLTEHLSKSIQDLVTLDQYQIQQEELERTHEEKIGIGTAEQPQRVDSALREQRFARMYKDFVNTVLTCTGSRHKDICKKIQEIFLSAMDISDRSEKYQGMAEKITELCVLNNETDDDYYQSLIERFARDVFEVQIKLVQGQDRLNKFREEAANFSSLGVFYRTADGDSLSYFHSADSPLWRLLLYPESVNADPTPTNNQVIQRLCELTGLTKAGDTISKMVDDIIAQKGPETLKIIEEVFLNFCLPTRAEAVTFGLVKDRLLEIIGESGSKPVNILEEILTGDRYQTDVTKKHSNYNYEQVCKEFNDDILALQLVLQKAVVPAVSIDKAFSARETRLIEAIVGMLNDARFDDFIARNAEDICAVEFGRMKEEEGQRALDAAVMNEINTILSELMNTQIENDRG